MSYKLYLFSSYMLFFAGQIVLGQKVKRDTVSINDIDEVVVLGYGTKSVKKATSSVSKIKGKVLTKVSAYSADVLLQGTTTGFSYIRSTRFRIQCQD